MKPPWKRETPKSPHTPVAEGAQRGLTWRFSHPSRVCACPGRIDPSLDPSQCPGHRHRAGDGRGASQEPQGVTNHPKTPPKHPEELLSTGTGAALTSLFASVQVDGHPSGQTCEETGVRAKNTLKLELETATQTENMEEKQQDVPSSVTPAQCFWGRYRDEGFLSSHLGGHRGNQQPQPGCASSALSSQGK